MGGYVNVYCKDLHPTLTSSYHGRVYSPQAFSPPLWTGSLPFFFYGGHCHDRFCPRIQSRDFSSTDPAQQNGDFNHPLRVTSDGQYLIAEAYGPGEIVSIWSTINGGDVTNDGAITIQLDGQTVLSTNYESLVSGNYGAPFVWPLVGNLYDTSGGAQIKVPMPYTKSMLVTVQGNPDYFHVIYRQFNDANGIQTFNPKDKALDVIAKLRAFGVSDPKPAASGATTTSAAINIPTASQAQLVQLNGPAEITQLRLQLPQVQDAPYVVDDGRAFGAGGSSQFTVAINPANQGVTITRRYDPEIGNQVADIYVDGTLAGQWTTGAGVPAGPWADVTVTLPSSLITGKSQITITNRFVSSNVDFNEFRYDVSCLVNGEWTRSDTVDVGPNHPGEESAHSYTIAGPTWQGVRGFSYPVDAQTAANSMAVLEGARLQIVFDGQTTVDAPIGEFFGSGLGKYDVRTLMFSVDNVPQAGNYNLSAAMTQAPDYGIVGLAVDGTALGQPFDGYHANGVTIDFSVNFGTVALAAGIHQLTWTVTGKNPSSANYLVGIDYLVFALQ